MRGHCNGCSAGAWWASATIGISFLIYTAKKAPKAPVAKKKFKGPVAPVRPPDRPRTRARSPMAGSRKISRHGLRRPGGARVDGPSGFRLAPAGRRLPGSYRCIRLSVMTFVRARFADDLRDEMLRWLRSNGYQDPKRLDHDGVSFAFHNVHRRLIAPDPRKVVWSRQLRARAPVLHSFHQTGLAEIERRATAGEDLTPHLSRRVRKTDYYDGLLDDWGIHHLHLGTTIGTDGHVVDPPHGTPWHNGEILYVYVRPDAIYLLDVLGHGAHFGNEHLIDVLHSNWPDLIARYKYPDVYIELISPPTAEERVDLRRGGVQVPAATTKDGTMYFPLGGGISTSRMGARNVTESDYLFDTYAELQRGLQEAAESLGRTASAVCRRPVIMLSFRVHLTGRGFEIVEETLNKACRFLRRDDGAIVGVRLVDRAESIFA